jgi:phosphoribosylformylglycinamidine (FGAM) synthase PurS component
MKPTPIVFICYKDPENDKEGLAKKRDIEEDLQIKGIENIRFIRAYEIVSELNEEQVNKIGEDLLCDSIIQLVSVNQVPVKDYDWIITVGYKQGVTENWGRTAERYGIPDIGIDFSGKVHYMELFVIKGEIRKEDVEKIGNYLHNPVVQYAKIEEVSK